MKSARPLLFALITLGLAVAAPACSDDDAGTKPPDAGGIRADSGPPHADGAPGTDGGGLPKFTGGDPKFTATHAEEEGYWYSRYNLLSLSLKSGSGVTFMPNPAAVAQMVKMVSDSRSTAKPPKHPALLRRVYDTGNPFLVSKPDGDLLDFLDERWSAATAKTTSGRTFGWTLMKEVEWAKQFNVDSHFGIPGKNDIPGAQQRFAGMMMATLAVMQAVDLSKNLADYNLAGAENQWVALGAISDLVDLLSAKTFSIVDAKGKREVVSTSNRYAKLASLLARGQGMKDGAALIAKIRAGADRMYGALPAPTTVREQAVAVQMLPWYIMATKTNAAAARARLDKMATALAKRTPTNIVERAAMVRALVSAGRALKSSAHIRAAHKAFGPMVADYDGAKAVFKSRTTYTPDDLGFIFGAITGVLLYDPQVKEAVAKQMRTDIFENIVNLSGLQASAPPVSAIPAYEQDPSPSKVDPLIHRYTSLPVPPKAGGTFGVAPVFMGEVRYGANGKWTVTKKTFDTAGSFHLANEMIWFHDDEINGFPVL